jgi:DNA-binding MarR family transcriptional regulator
MTSPEAMTIASPTREDRVDLILRQWASERPDIDTSPMGVIGRIMRVDRHLDRELARAYKATGLDFGLFDVLATLRRSGAPFSLSPRDLNAWCMLTSGAMTARLDRLEEAGYIARRPDPDDRRGLLVELTPTGFALIDKLVIEHLANEERLLGVLSPEQRQSLGDLLRELLISLEANA